MNRINNYEQHIIRRREMLALTGLERGLVSGWEERSLWEYTGPSGKHRLYSRSDVVSMALAAELCRAGINARYAWDAVKQNIKHVLTGKIKYIVATQRGTSFRWEGIETFDKLLRNTIDPSARAVIILGAGEICREVGEAIDRYFAENLPEGEIVRRMALNDAEDAG